MSADNNSSTNSTTSKQNQTRKAREAELALQLLRNANPKRTQKSQEEHKFWNTQPVPKYDDAKPEKEKEKNRKEPTEHNPEDFGPIDKIKTIDEVSADPLPLPDGFYWVNLTIDDEDEVKEMYKLLSKHYVEDDDNMFRFNYSSEFLLWALKPPGWRKDWHVGIRTKPKGNLVACITATPADIRAYKDTVKMVEINFLCVHKKLRNKRLAPVLIKEITRRVNRTDRWQAVYTAGVVLPRPIARNRYWHRSLNPKKLIDIGFSRLSPKLTMQGTIRLYKLPEEPLTPGFRELKKADIPQAHALLSTYLKDFKVYTEFSPGDFEHWFMPRDGVIDCYVVEDPTTKKITDIVSFYTLPSSVLNNKKYDNLKAAYSFYNIAKSVPWEVLMKDALIMAKKKDFDVFNALDLMHNTKFLKNLNFGIGDGHLQYYFFNWKCPEVKAEEVGIVLL